MKIDFVIDGFNLYHTFDKQKNTRWLDLISYCQSFLQDFGKDAKLGKVYYFSALATHLSPHTTDKNSDVYKHLQYIQALESSGVVVQLGRFKKKTIKYSKKNEVSIRLYKNEEKETDVAIGMQMFDTLHNNSADAIALVTGDTDLCAAIRVLKKNFPDKKIVNILPFRSVSRQLSDMCDQTLKTKEWRYLKHQFNDKITLKDGKIIEKPINW